MKRTTQSRYSHVLYSRPLPASRSGPLYNAFPYPTKISPEAIALYIAAHTRPGATIFDGFAGSGTTGLAALLCDNPSAALRAETEKLGLDVQWGARNAVLYELGALGAFVARTLTNPPDPKMFRKAANSILKNCEEENRWIYEARDPSGNTGHIRYIIWSDLLRCPACGTQTSLFDACVSHQPARISSTFLCPTCREEGSLDDVERVLAEECDPIIGQTLLQRVRVIARVYGKTGRTTWVRTVESSDLGLLRRIESLPLPQTVPISEIPWGDLHRRGYHQGVTHVHHFYTRRNLFVFGRLWECAEAFDDKLRDALQLWLLSYNASHATIMTRVVAKRGQKDLILTSAQPGVLYISGLPVEKNLFEGLRRKLSVIATAYEAIHGKKGRIEVHQRSSCNVDLPDESIDYVFTDPPFGSNIPYAEVNFLNEAWLGRYTDRSEEVIVSDAQNKSVEAYRVLLATALSEARRILKKGGKATLVFHSASAQIWNALQEAYTAAGFSVERVGILDKTQGSFKQVTTGGAVRGDPVLLLSKQPKVDRNYEACVWSIAKELVEEAMLLGPSEQTAQRLYSRLVTHFLIRGAAIPVDAGEFYRWLEAQRQKENDRTEA